MSSPDTHILAAGSILWRLYFAAGAYPSAWYEFRHGGPLGHRFDHHLLDTSDRMRVQDRGILYAAVQVPACIAEVLQHQRHIDRSSRKPYLAAFKLIEPLTLIDFRKRHPMRMGASSTVNSGPRPAAARWSAALYNAFENIQGIIYPPSMSGGGDCLALYERSTGGHPDPASI